MNKYLLIYHKEDNDGVCSAAIVANQIKKMNKEDYSLIYFPATYKLLSDLYLKGEEYLNEYFDNYTHVIMCDVSFNEYKAMIYLKNKFKQNFIWFDHHLPIIKESFKHKFDNLNGVRDHTRSTILNVYKYFYDEFDILYNNKKAPKLLWYLSTFDSWTHKENNLDFEEVMYVNTSITKTSNLSLSFWLQEIDNEAQFRFFGGDLMSAVGGTRVKHYKELAYMGFIPVLLHLRTIMSNMSRCKKDIIEWKPDVLILVDYPGFNLSIAEHIHKNSDIPVYYYISPKIWAWKEHRIKNIKRDVDELFSILPFEIDFFEKKLRRCYDIDEFENTTVENIKNGKQYNTAAEPVSGGRN
mgnify:CR=1 FL=1